MPFKKTPVCKPLKATGHAVSARQENEGQLSPHADRRPLMDFFMVEGFSFKDNITVVLEKSTVQSFIY